MTVNEVIDAILRREGGFVHRAADRGGPTNLGITQATLAEWRGRPVSVDDVRDLTEKEARELYRERYIERPGFLAIENERIRGLVVDCAVNHGVSGAIKLLQKAVRVFPDGKFGPISKAATNRMTAAVVYRRLIAARVRFYAEIISKDPELKRAVDAGFVKLQALNAGGWFNRAAEFIEESP